MIVNFLCYVDVKCFDGMEFYCVMWFGFDLGLIQGGIQGDGICVFLLIVYELIGKIGIFYIDGIILFVWFVLGIVCVDFFIMIGLILFFDVYFDQFGDNVGFVVFGYVVEGMDVVCCIFVVLIFVIKGEGLMWGQMIVVLICIFIVCWVVVLKF